MEKLVQDLNWKALRKHLGDADVDRLIILKVDQREVRCDGVD